MKKEKFLNYLSLLGMPLLLAALGLVLIVNPDSASAFLAKLLGWILIGIGAVCGLMAIGGTAAGRVGKILAAVAAVAGGAYLLANPLILAEALGIILGIVLAAQGVGDLITALKARGSDARFSPGFLMSVITAAVGVALILLPMTASRLMIRICGVVVLLVGGTELWDRLRSKKKLEENKPPVIDAEE